MLATIFTCLLLICLGFFILIKSSDLFVDKMSAFAKSIGVSEFIIGLTIVALGTSFPELVSSIISTLKGLPELTIGSLLGSNIANIGLILGLSGMIGNIDIEHKIIKRDGYMMMFAAIIFYIFAISLEMSRAESFILLLIYVSYIIFLFKERKVFEKEYFSDFLSYTISLKFLKNLISKKSKYSQKTKMDIKSLIISGFSLAGVIIGSMIVVNNAIKLSTSLGISEGFVGLTLIALGTSLPELSISLLAAKKGHGEIALGNVFGSNIANTLLIIGISSFIAPFSLSGLVKYFIIPFMLLLYVLLLVFIQKENILYRWQSRILFVLYLLFISVNVIFLI